MAIARIIFLFDYERFGKTVTPALDELRNGSYNGLQKLATDSAKEYPEVWELMDNLYYFGIADKTWDTNNIDDAITFWITLLICRYSLELDTKLEISDPTFSSPSVLDQLGVDEKLIETFLWGKPVRELLVTSTALHNNLMQYPFENLRFKIGWLSIEDIVSIKNEIQVNQKQKNHAAFTSWLSILNTAIKGKKGLALGVVM